MGAVEQLMDVGEWTLELDPDVHGSVLDSLDPRQRLWSTLVVTPDHWHLGDLSDADLLGQACYLGVLLGAAADRRTLWGAGLSWWLGQDQGGTMFVGAPFTSVSASFSTLLSNQVISRSGGFTAGTVTADAGTFKVKIEGGDTAREILDSLCRQAEDGPYMWRVRHNGTTFVLDAAERATLWPSASTPTVMLCRGGGRDAQVTGLTADITLDGLNGEDVLTHMFVDWNKGVANGSAAATLPSTFRGLTGAATVRGYRTTSPRRREPDREKWRKWAAWRIVTQTQANKTAAAEITERSTVLEEVTARVQVENPWDYDLTPGCKVYLDDVDLGLTDTDNEVYFRGEVRHPASGRVDEMTAPFVDGNGMYLRYWTGATYDWVDLSREFVGEEPGVELKINQRSRIGRRARPGRVSPRQRRAIRRLARRQARLIRYLEAVG